MAHICKAKILAKDIFYINNKRFPSRPLDEHAIITFLDKRGFKDARNNRKIAAKIVNNPEKRHTDDDVSKILDRFEVGDLQQMVNDTLRPIEKVLANIETHGPLTIPALTQIISKSPFISSLRQDVVRNLVLLLETENKIFEGPDGYQAYKPESREVSLLSRPVENLWPAYHRTVKISAKGKDPLKDPGDVFEVIGKEKLSLEKVVMTLYPGDSIDPLLNGGVQKNVVQSVTNAIPRVKVGDTDKSDLQIQLWHQEFLWKHPTYVGGVIDCRTHARDFIEFLTDIDIGLTISYMYGP